MATVDAVIKDVRECWRPPKRLALSEWADEYAFLSAESSAQEGRWRTLTYQKEIMDSMTDPEVEMVVVMKSARVGYTKMVNHLIGYHVHQDPCSIMMVQPTIEDAEGYSKEEIAPMIRDTPVLRGLVSEAKSKDANNTILSKSFPGGVLSIVGANSPRGFRRVSRRVVIFDETDGYPPSAGSEGDQIKLGIRRSEYFWNRKIVAGSTPTDKGSSRIENMFFQTDQRRLFVQCPCCEEWQYLKWGGRDAAFGIKWPPGKPDEAYYLCEHNGCVIEHSQKYDMLDKAEWRATAQSQKPGLRGYHIWAAYSYSPNASWGQLAREWIDAQSDPLKLKTFINTVLGESWEEQGESVDPTGLLARCEDYGSELLPDGVAVITCGVDVQHDRVEMEFTGWGAGEETWSLDYVTIHGNTADMKTMEPLIDMHLLNRTFQHPLGFRLRPVRAFVDSGDGTRSQEVYNYTKVRESFGVFACKGMDGTDRPIAGPPSSVGPDKDVVLFPVGTMQAKDMIYGRLKLPEYGPGFMHFPKRYGVEYFEQLTAEEVRTKVNSKGFTVREYVKKRKRNEALDCRVYSYGALYSTSINVDQVAAMIRSPQVAQGVGRKVRG